MQWTPPASDGGADITHYVIEMKEKNMNDWQESKRLSVKEVMDLGGKIQGKQDGLIEIRPGIGARVCAAPMASTEAISMPTAPRWRRPRP